MKVAPKKAHQNYKYTCATIGVSMGSPQHTGVIFENLVAWASQNFKTCIIDLSDTLHRHNLVSDATSMEQAYELSLAEGDAWLLAHQPIIDRIGIPVQTIRWNHWLGHPDYNENLTLFQKAFAEQSIFRDAVMDDIMKYFNRKGLALNYLSPERIQNAINYLLEELAAHSILYKEHPSITLYPGKQHNCYNLVREGLIKNVPTGLQQSEFTRMIVYNFDQQSKTRIG